MRSCVVGDERAGGDGGGTNGDADDDDSMRALLSLATVLHRALHVCTKRALHARPCVCVYAHAWRHAFKSAWGEQGMGHILEFVLAGHDGMMTHIRAHTNTLTHTCTHIPDYTHTHTHTHTHTRAPPQSLTRFANTAATGGTVRSRDATRSTSVVMCAGRVRMLATHMPKMLPSRVVVPVVCAGATLRKLASAGAACVNVDAP